MSSLFDSLNSVARALDAQRYGLDVAGQNIANVNTPGYARRTVDLVALAPGAPGTAGRGVDVAGIRAQRDRLLEARLSREVPAQMREKTVADALSVVEASIGLPGASIDENIDKFFDAFADLADMPASASHRDSVLIQGENLAAAFRNMSTRLEAARRDADRQITGSVDDINSLIERIASLNLSIGSGSEQEKSLHARDEQLEMVRRLSEIAEIQVLERPDGGVDISMGQSRPVVVGQTRYLVTAQSAPPSGYAALSINGMDVTSEITSGKLGGYLQVRDGNIPSYMQRLDDLAAAIVAEVNAEHGAGFNQLGAAAGTFFEFSTAPGAGNAGAASFMTVRPAVAADPRLVAAGNTAAAGDNGAARDIANLRQRTVMNGGTATISETWAHLVYRVARDTQTASAERDSRGEIVRQIDALRDAVSGVSLDEEAMMLMKFQRAYEANARFFQTVDSMLELLINMSR